MYLCVNMCVTIVGHGFPVPSLGSHSLVRARIHTENRKVRDPEGGAGEQEAHTPWHQWRSEAADGAEVGPGYG